MAARKTKRTKKKKETRRSIRAYPALDPAVNLKTRQDLIDYDYVGRLNDDEKQWLNKFTEEYTNAKLDSKNLKKNLHNTDALKKDCYDRNNARNRCILTRANAQGLAYSIGDLNKRDKTDEEDKIIDQLDELPNESDNLDNTDNDTDKNGETSEDL